MPVPAIDLERYFRFQPAGKTLADVETPIPVIDLDVVERNLTRWQERCDAKGLANRPHIKTHKLVPLAQAQLDLGAKGITVQKLGEAEVMAEAGIEDMLLTFNVLGEPKLARLAKLARSTGIAVVADSGAVVEGVGEAGRYGNRPIRVLIECDTGGGRCGVQSPKAALELAKSIDRTRGVRFGGLMTYARAGTRKAAGAFLAETKAMCERAGLEVATVSTGGSPDMWLDDGLDLVTEYRAGTYIYNDRSLANRGTCTFEDCALTVLTTVVSRPTPDRAIIDAGSKALTSDLIGLQGYGLVRELEGARIYDVNEEHGYVDVSACHAKPAIGDVIHIIPNHACPVSNLYDRILVTRGARILGTVMVDARGLVA